MTRFVLLLAGTAALFAQEPRRWSVAGQVREALVYAPAAARQRPTPVVFVFHGHGGTMRQAAGSFRVHALWPDALVIYPQGLNTPGRLTDAGGKRPGWQATAADQGGRDLAFFDAILAGLRADYQVDAKRVFVTGHSNGGGFTYLLWAHRGALLTAVAPSGAVAAPEDRGRLSPKPVLHIAGRRDALVKFSWQEQMIELLRRTNGSVPVRTFLYDGGHRLPEEAGRRIVEFFQNLR